MSADARAVVRAEMVKRRVAVMGYRKGAQRALAADIAPVWGCDAHVAYFRLSRWFNGKRDLRAGDRDALLTLVCGPATVGTGPVAPVADPSERETAPETDTGATVAGDDLRRAQEPVKRVRRRRVPAVRSTDGGNGALPGSEA